ncbi:MAG: aquaporin family protein [Clostridiaceae bacterium]|nr:aquaporin family protein [Clostridiaceae bacterium]
MKIFLAELIGTFMLILLGDGVVANVTLNKSGMKGAGSIQITFAWGLAVLLPAFIFGAASGAHFNPAVTIALAITGGISWSAVPTYFLGEMLGAFLGGIMVWLLFKEQFDATDDPGAQLGVFSTGPSVPNVGLNILSEAVGTFVLVFGILGISQVAGIATGVDKLFVFGIIVSIGMSLGGLTGYAINPARDLGPRIAYAVLPFKNKDCNWGYAWIPVVGPIIGAVVAALLDGALRSAGVFF